MYLFSGIETPRNWYSKESGNHSCFILPCVIPMALSPHWSLPKIYFLYSFFKGGLWITSAPDPEAWWLKLNSISWARDVQACPVFLSFFSNENHKAKFLKNINVIVTYSRPLMLQGLLEHKIRNRSPSSRLVSNPNFAQPGVPWVNIRHLYKLPEGWEENASRYECRFMLPRKPRVCVVWMRSRCSLDSKLGVNQSPPVWLPPGVKTTGVSPLCLVHGWNSPEYCFPTSTWRQVCWSIWNQTWGATAKELPLLSLQTTESSRVVDAIDLSLTLPFLEVS